MGPSDSSLVCPHCKFEQSSSRHQCVRCRADMRASQGQVGPSEGRLKRLVLAQAEDLNPIIVGARALIFLLLLVWGIGFIRIPIEYGEINDTFMHNVNLVFHEAGHILFMPFGRFMAVLGGTLGQLLIPLICMCVLLFKTRDPFGASVGLWWVGQSLLDVAPYVYDARLQELMLLGGVTGRDASGYHDWNNILGMLGWLSADQTIARGVYWVGTLLMVIALSWGGLLMYRQIMASRDAYGARR